MRKQERKSEKREVGEGKKKEDGSEKRVEQESRGIQRQDMIRELEEIRSRSFLFSILVFMKAKFLEQFTKLFIIELLIK